MLGFDAGSLTFFTRTLYSSIPPSRRVQLALEIASALTALYEQRADVIASQLAALFEIGRQPWEASHHFLVAARSAAPRFAFREAP